MKDQTRFADQQLNPRTALVHEHRGLPMKIPQAHRHHHSARFHAFAAREGDKESTPDPFDQLDIDGLDLGNELLLKPHPVLGERLDSARLTVLEAALTAPVLEPHSLRSVDGSRESE